MTDQEPLFALKFYEGMIVACRRVGRRWTEYFVDGQAVRQVLAGVPVSSGLLAQGTLGMGTLDGTPFYVALITPRKVTVGTRGATEREWTFTTPPIVWAGWGAHYRIYALHARDLALGWPKSLDAPLYIPPFANTYRSGGICWGSGRTPGPAQLATMEQGFMTYAEDSFFHERNTAVPSKKYLDDVTALYASLKKSRRYPCDDLVAQGKTLAHVISGDAFRVTTTLA